MSTGEIRTIFCQVASAISHVHGRGYVLRDLKPENVLLDSQNCVKICDFGWCAPLDDLTFRSSRAGTLAYMSPESLCAQPQDQASDLWSLGVLLFEMFLNKEPFLPIKSVEELGDILPTITCIDARPHLADQLDMFREQLAGIMRGPLSFGTGSHPPPEARALIISLLNFDRRSRPSIEQVLRSPFARGQTLRPSPSNPARPQPRRAASAASAPSQPAPEPIVRNPQPPQLPATSQPRFFTPQIEVRKSQAFVPNPGRALRPDSSVERPVSRSGPVCSLGSFTNLPDNGPSQARTAPSLGALEYGEETSPKKIENPLMFNLRIEVDKSSLRDRRSSAGVSTKTAKPSHHQQLSHFAWKIENFRNQENCLPASIPQPLHRFPIQTQKENLETQNIKQPFSCLQTLYYKSPTSMLPAQPMAFQKRFF